MKAALYLRVSTIDKGQDIEVQLDPLREWTDRLGYEPVMFIEAGVSGAKTTRPALDEMMMAVRRREVQAVAVLKLDRLGRSLSHLLQLLGEFEANAVRLLIHDTALDTATPQGRLFFSIIGAFAEYERALIAERVKDGMKFASTHGTKSGKAIGRPRANVDFMSICEALSKRAGERGAAPAVAKMFGVSEAWVYKHVIPILKAAEEEVG